MRVEEEHAHILREVIFQHVVALGDEALYRAFFYIFEAFLRVGNVVAYILDLVVEELDADRIHVGGAEYIDDAAAHGELPRRPDEVAAFVALLREPVGEAVAPRLLPHLELAEIASGRKRRHERGRSRGEDASAVLEILKHVAARHLLRVAARFVLGHRQLGQHLDAAEHSELVRVGGEVAHLARVGKEREQREVYIAADPRAHRALRREVDALVSVPEAVVKCGERAPCVKRLILRHLA